MRIITGKAKGARLVSFRGDKIRPTLDRVKESLFNQLQGRLPGAWFLDLFAGTGNIGLEALSRGAAGVVFVENERKAQELIAGNLRQCRFAGPAEGCDWVLLKMDALQALTLLEREGRAFDLVYVDPPFAAGLYAETLARLGASSLLREEALVIVEHFRKQALAAAYGKIECIKQRRCGDTCLSFFSPAPARAPA